MENVKKQIGHLGSLLTKYIGIIIIVFSILAFFWRDGFAWTTNYTSVFLGAAMFGMGLTIRMGDFQIVFSHPREVVVGAAAQYTVMPVAWILAKALQLPQDIALGVILVGCCPGGTASNVITYIAGGDVALSVGMTIVSTAAAPLMTPILVYVLLWCLGEGILLGDGAFCGEGYSDSGPSGHFASQSVRKTDPEDHGDTAADFGGVDCYDYLRYRCGERRKDCKLWCARTGRGYSA